MAAVALPAADYFNGSITNQNAKDAQDDTLAYIRQSVQGAATETQLTISTGSVTATGTAHSIETESSAASDDLTNIAVTNMVDGQLLVIRAVNASHVVTVKHLAGGSGQINLRNAGDTILDSLDKYIELRRNGSNWDEVDRNYGDQRVLAKSADYTVVAKDDGYVIKVDASGGAKVITMTAATTLKGNHHVTVEKADTSTNTVTIARSGSDTFGGAATSVVLNRVNQAMSLACDGVSDFRLFSRSDPGLDVWCGASGGTANAMTFTPVEAVKALYTGLKVRGTVTTTNTSKTMTLAVSGLTAKNVKKRINAAVVLLGVGENNGTCTYEYDGTQWILKDNNADSQADDIASAGTLDFDSASGNWGHVTGTTTATAITLAQGSRFLAIFDGALTITNGSSLITLTGANMVTVAGECYEFVGEASGVVRMVNSTKSAAVAATQAEQESASSTAKYVSPGRQHFHPSAFKTWAKTTLSGGSPSMDSDYGMSSVGDNGVGDFTYNFDSNFSDGNYAYLGMARSTGNLVTTCVTQKVGVAPAQGSCRVFLANPGNAAANDADHSVAFMGDF